MELGQEAGLREKSSEEADGLESDGEHILSQEGLTEGRRGR